MSDLGLTRQRDVAGSLLEEVKTETDLSATLSTSGGIKSSSDSNVLSESDSSKTAFKLLNFLVH